jgi:hypothetical protein
MAEECVKELFAKPITSEALETCVHTILKKVSIMNSPKKKIILKANGTKVGFLTEKVPIDEIKISKYWVGPFGIKTELSYQGRFVGILMLRK